MSATTAYFLMVNVAFVAGALWGYLIGKRAHEFKQLNDFTSRELRDELERRDVR